MKSCDSSPPTGEQQVLPAVLFEDDAKIKIDSGQTHRRLKTHLCVGGPVLMKMQRT